MNRLLLLLFFLLAPILVIFISAKSYAEDSSIGVAAITEDSIKLNEVKGLDVDLEKMDVSLTDLTNTMVNIQESVKLYETVFAGLTKTISNSIQSSKEQMYLSEDIYDQRLERSLGKPIGYNKSDNSEIKVYELTELGYRGYIAKIKLFNPDVFKVALAGGELGKIETTSAAAKRTGAILAINGGGFGVGKVNGAYVSTMVGGTVVDGDLVNNFVRKRNEDIFFVGIDKQGKLVGNIPETEKDIMDLNPQQGLSFIPILIENGKKVELPSKWANTVQPRTIIGQYENGNIILIVVDGRQGDYSIGITLERLQEKLIAIGIKSAYNLDGGGSTAMYFKGKILNKPSDGRERPVANNFIVLP